MWGGEHSGIYTVRSGYRLLLPTVALQPLDHQLLYRIWDLDCPPKVRIAIWKVCKFYLPTKAMLYFKRICFDNACSRCHSNCEDVSHVFRLCPFAHAVWSCLGYDTSSQGNTFNFHEWLAWLFDIHSHTKRREIALTIWGIWTARNKLIHEGKRQSATDLAGFVRRYCADLCSLVVSSHSMTHVCPGKWSPLSVPSVKVNVDASYSPSHQKA